MYYLAFSVVKNASDVEEVISESIYRAFYNLHSLKTEGSFKPWIMRIVHNTAVEMIRKTAKTVDFEQIEDISVDSYEKSFTNKFVLREAVDCLKQPYRTVVVLFYYENLSVKEIAQITDTSIVTVRQQLSRARKMLKEILKEDFLE